MLDKLSYLAGLVDGEGCIGTHGAGATRSPRFVIEIKMTEESIIDWLQQNFGGFKQFRPSTNPKWKDQWRWRLENGKARELYKQLQPLLKIKNATPTT